MRSNHDHAVLVEDALYAMLPDLPPLVPAWEDYPTAEAEEEGEEKPSSQAKRIA